jgi:hypothetical protein
MKYYVDHVDIFHIDAKMGNNERTEMQPKFQHLHNPSVFVATPKVGRTSLNDIQAYHAVITQKYWVLNELWQAFAQLVFLWENRVPHTWLLNTGPGGYDNHPTDLHQHSGVVHIRLLH